MASTLLVDDHAVFREPIRAVLEQEGHRVHAAADGIAAIASMAVQTPDLILLDMQMPGLSGREVLAHVRGTKSLARLPAIVMTARSDRQCVLDMARLGVSAYLLKDGFSLDRMLAAVRSVLDPSQEARAALSDTGRAATARPDEERCGTSRVPELPEAPADGAATVASARPNPGTAARALLGSIRPLMSRAEVAERVASLGEFRGLSPVVTEVLRLTASPSCTVDAVAAAIGQDQGMSLRVIRLANSSAYSPGAAVDSVRRAVVQIGLRRIRQTLLALGLVERFNAPAFESRLSTGRFWQHSLACGLIAAGITRTTDPADADAAFICGLLHDVGRIVLAEQLGDAYSQVLDTAATLQLPLEQVESRMLSVNHADIMAMIARQWRLPQALGAPIALHHAPMGSARTLGARLRPEVLRLIAANRLAHALMLGSSGNDTVSPTSELLRHLQLDEPAVATITASARDQAAEIGAAMLPSLSGCAALEPREHYKGQLDCDLRPLFAAETPGLDAHAILCGELAKTKRDGPPNVIVVCASRDEDGASVARRVLSAEARAGVDTLPLLLLSPKWEFPLDSGSLGSRAVATLKTPVPIARVVAALRQLLLGAG